jgi:hypothetical protein
MSDDDYLKRIREYSEELRKDPVRLRAFMRSVMGPPQRTLEGQEREHVLTLLHMIAPFEQSNNQRTWTDSYRIGKTVYHVTHFPDSDQPIVDEVLEEQDDFQ